VAISENCSFEKKAVEILILSYTFLDTVMVKNNENNAEQKYASPTYHTEGVRINRNRIIRPVDIRVLIIAI
jgi:hypothetical protein